MNLLEELALAKEKGLVLEEAMTIYNMPLYHRLKENRSLWQTRKIKNDSSTFLAVTRILILKIVFQS